MKISFFAILISVLLVLVFCKNSVAQQADIDSINRMIREKNMEALSDYFPANIYLSVPNAEGRYSKMQGMAIIESFFANHSLKDLTTIKQGNLGKDTYYCILEYETQIQNYKIYYQIQPTEKQYMIREFKINESK